MKYYEIYEDQKIKSSSIPFYIFISIFRNERLAIGVLGISPGWILWVVKSRISLSIDSDNKKKKEKQRWWSSPVNVSWPRSRVTTHRTRSLIIWHSVVYPRIFHSCLNVLEVTILDSYWHFEKSFDTIIGIFICT